MSKVSRRQLITGAGAGAGAAVFGTAFGGTAAGVAGRGPVLTGVVERISRRGRTISLNTTKGSREVHVTNKTVLWRGKVVGLAGFKPGDEITAEGSRRDGRFVAKRVTSTFRIVDALVTSRDGARLVTGSGVVRLTPTTIAVTPGGLGSKPLAKIGVGDRLIAHGRRDAQTGELVAFRAGAPSVA